VTYLPTAIVARRSDEWSVAVPVVGPLVLGGQYLAEAATRPSCPSCFLDRLFQFLTATAGILLFVDGLAQAGGIAMTVLGVVRPRQVLRYEPARAGVRWAMTPGAAGTPLGLTFSLTHL
jgi:hypothetical protein